MDNNLITKTMLHTRSEGKRGTGRPKLTWGGGDSVDHDIRILGERNLALNKEEWRKRLKKARAHAGLLSQ
jgi:hypothetical protein